MKSNHNIPRTCIVLALGIASPSGARADGGEAYVNLRAGPELAWIDYVRDGAAHPAPLAPLFRFGVEGRYGLSNAWHVATGVELAFTEITYWGVEVEGQAGDLLTSYFDVTLPIGLEYLLNFGHDYSGRIWARTGLVVAHWADTGLLEPTDPSIGYPIDLLAHDSAGLLAGLGVEFEYRFLDWLAASIGLYGDLRFIDERTHWAVGLTIRPSAIFGVGPSF